MEEVENLKKFNEILELMKGKDEAETQRKGDTYGLELSLSIILILFYRSSFSFSLFSRIVLFFSVLPSKAFDLCI